MFFAKILWLSYRNKHVQQILQNFIKIQGIVKSYDESELWLEILIRISINIKQFLEQMGEQKIEDKETVKKKYSVPSYERRDTFAI